MHKEYYENKYQKRINIISLLLKTCFSQYLSIILRTIWYYTIIIKN